MRPGDFSDQPNPFDLGSRSAPRRRFGWGKPGAAKVRPVVATLKLLALVAIGFAVTLVAGGQSRRWLAQRLTADFETLAVDEKKQRLVQISELGVSGIEPLVRRLKDPDDDIASTAHDLLRRTQNEWQHLSRRDQLRRHQVLAESLTELAVQIQDDRTGWASGLLQQAVSLTVNDPDETSRSVYLTASEGLSRLSLSQRPGPSVLRQGEFEWEAPKRLSVQPQPLPVTNADSGENWVDWPSAEAPTEGIPSGEAGISPAPDVAPTIYRSAAMPLKSVESGQDVVLRQLETTAEPGYTLSEIRPVTSLVDSPLETFDDRSVMQWLGSPHQALRERAKLELVRRGFDGGQIALATQIVGGDVATRLALVDTIARNSTRDPRPWLLLLLDDENREVTLRAISVLATMDDPAIAAQLQMRLVDQVDPIVAARLRRVLNVR